MGTLITSMLTAVWLGILTSISPCPLATNIAAISYIGKQVANIRRVLLFGFAYSIGGMLRYLVVGGIVVAGVLSIPAVSTFLQRYMIMILGPLLIIAGMFLLDLISINLPGTGMSETAQRYADKGGVWGAGILGVIFALSLCPISAALFFGSLIPLAVNQESTILLPSLYGIGTGLPVLAFAVLIAVSAKSVGVIFNKLTVFELWARRVTGIIFIAVGLYLSLTYILNIF